MFPICFIDFPFFQLMFASLSDFVNGFIDLSMFFIDLFNVFIDFVNVFIDGSMILIDLVNVFY